MSDGLVSWIDITGQTIFTYLDGELRSNVLPIEATVILGQMNDLILLGSATEFGTFDLSSGVYSSYWTFDSVLRPTTHRSNDGCQLQRGGYLIGAMHRIAPGSNPGAIYHIDDEGFPTELDAAIYIPNSFIEIDDGSVLVSDSKLGIIYRYSISDSPAVLGKTIWYTAEDGIAPDGGCRLPNGNIAIAMWDAACVREFDQFGAMVRDIPVAAKRPTNCKYDIHSESLWVTSAMEGLDTVELRQYPQSGKTFCLPVSMD